MKIFMPILIALLLMPVAACKGEASQDQEDTENVNRQQAQYAKAQPIPFFNFSLERHLLIEVYKIRNENVATHTVWRSDTGVIEGDCPSMGYGIPYDTSLTNPLVGTDRDQDGWAGSQRLTSVGQPEPNGVFASTNTSATWVFCIAPGGDLAPVYVESKVTGYPGTVEVDYNTNRVVMKGNPNVTLKPSPSM